MSDAQTALAAAEQALASAENSLAAKSATSAAAIAAVVSDWVRTSLAGGPIARATDGWNQLQAALPALVTALEKEIS
jgi:Tfp pilus assembly protein PilX